MTRRPVVLVAHPSPELYGSDRVMLEGISGLVEAGARVVLTLPEDGPGADEARRRGAEVELCPTLVLRKALLTPRGLPVLVRDTVRGLARGLRLTRRVRPDVLYVSTVTIPLWTTVARLRRVRSVVHVHEAESTAPRVVRWALAVPVALGRRVVANSRFSIGVLGSVMPRLAARTRLLPNAVPGPAELTPGRATLDGPLRVLYVGRLSPRKGVDVAVRAVARLVADGRPADLDLVGSVFAGYEWYEAELDDLVHELGLDGAVRRRGFVDDVWGPLAESDVVVVPSRLDEPFGNTAVEAILAGRPVVASATSGLLEATRGYAAARTVPPGDADALADALAAVAADWPRLREAALADAAVAQDRHSPAGYRTALARLVLEGVAR